jgi:hypothetical protein
MRAAFCTVSLSALAKLLVAFFFQQTTKVPESAQIIFNLSPLAKRATDEKQFCLRTGNLRNLNFDLAATGAACLLK